MADDALNRLRAANPVPDPDRLAVAGEAAEPADPELQDLLYRARRIKADETDDELLDRRENEGPVLRPVPLRRRDNRRLAWLAAAASLMLIAGAVVWTASQDATTDVGVVDAPPSPVETEDTGAGSAIPSGAGSSCEGDGRAGFAVAPDGTVTAGQPPQGERSTDKEGDTRIQGLVSIAETTVAFNRGSMVVTYGVDNPLGGPGGEVWHTLWLRSETGDETGVIHARGPGLAFGEHEILAGRDLDDLQPVDARFTQGTQPRGGMGGPVRLIIPDDALPVMSEPFLWAFEIREPDVGAGDICPAAVDPDEPLGDPSLMARFPDTD